MSEPVLHLTTDEMNHVEDRIRSLFPEHDQLLILHEIESKYCHSDIGILFKSEKNSKLPVILFTMGCSAAGVPIKDHDHAFEVIYKLPRSAFADDLSEDTCSICGKNPRMSTEIVKKEYRYVIEDMIRISKLPAMTGEYYGNGHTIEINSKRTVGLLSISNIILKKFNHNKYDFKLYHLVYLNKKQLNKILSVKNMLMRQCYLYSILKYNNTTLN